MADSPTAPKVLLLASPGEFSWIVYHTVNAQLPIAHVLLEQAQPKAAFLKRRLKRLGWLRTAGQVMFMVLALPLLRRAARPRIAELIAQYGCNTAPPPAEKIIQVASVNDESTRALLRRLEPDLVLVNGTRIISGKTLQSVPASWVNIHAGITPLYRGVHGGYWALAQRDPEHFGVTVHLIDPGIDTGGILEQAVLESGGQDNFATYPYLQLAAGARLMALAARRLLAGDRQTRPAPKGKSALWYHPTLWEYLLKRWKSGVK